MKYANEILLVFIYVVTAAAFTVNKKFDTATQKQSDLSMDSIPATISVSPSHSLKRNEDEESLVSLAARIAEFTDSSHRTQGKNSFVTLNNRQNVRNGRPSQEAEDMKDGLESLRPEHIKVVANNQATNNQKNNLTLLPSEQERTENSFRNSSSKAEQQNETRGDGQHSSGSNEHQNSISLNETEVESRLVGVWKLPAEFIGFDIANEQSLNVVKPAAVVKSRSFITSPEISSVRLNFVVPQPDPLKTNRRSSVGNSNPRRRQSYEGPYSSGEYSDEAPPSSTYTESDEDIGKLLDDDYRKRIEKQAEAFIKKQKAENNTDSSEEPPSHTPQTHSYDRGSYNGREKSHQALPQSENPHNDRKKSPPVYSQREIVHNKENKSPQIHYQKEIVYNRENKSPEIYSQPEIVYNRENKSPQIYSQRKKIYNRGTMPPQINHQPGITHNGKNRSPQTYSPGKNVYHGGNVFFYKGLDGMLYDKSLFPDLFGFTKTQNSPTVNEGYSEKFPPTTDVYLGPDYETAPLFFEDYPTEYVYIPSEYHPPKSKPHSDQLLANHNQELQSINEKQQHREEMPFKAENHRETQPFNDKHHRGTQPFHSERHHGTQPFNEGHHHESLPFNAEHHRESQPFNVEHHHGSQPFNEEHLHESRPFNEKHHRKPQLFNKNQHRGPRPINEEHHHRTQQLNEEQHANFKQYNEKVSRELPPVNNGHPREALRINDEQYRELQPVSEERNHEFLPVIENHQHQSLPFNEEHHSAIPYQPKESDFKRPGHIHYNSHTLEEDTDCSLEETDHSSGLTDEHEPLEPVPVHKLITHPSLPATDQYNSFDSNEGDNLHSFNNNNPTPENHDGQLNHEPIPQYENLNNPIPPSEVTYSQENDNPIHENYEEQLHQEPTPQQKNVENPHHPSSATYPYDNNNPTHDNYDGQLYNEHIPQQENTKDPTPPGDATYPYNANTLTHEGPLHHEPLPQSEKINHPTPPASDTVFPYQQHAMSREPNSQDNRSPETFQYERQHKYHVTLYEHDESSYRKHIPKVPYQLKEKTNIRFGPKLDFDSRETPRTIPQDPTQNLILPDDQTRHIKFNHGRHRHPFSAVSDPVRPDCHGTIEADSSQIESNVNSVPPSHHQERYTGDKRSGTNKPSSQGEMNENGRQSRLGEETYSGTGRSAGEVFHSSNPEGDSNIVRSKQSQKEDKHSSALKSTAPETHTRNFHSISGEASISEHQNQPKHSMVTVTEYENNPYRNQNGEIPKNNLNQNSRTPSPQQDSQTSPKIQDEELEMKQKTRRKSSKHSKARRQKRHGKKANGKRSKKSKKSRRSTKDELKAAAATYHWGMENHKDKDGFFLYANIPRHNNFEYGYRMGGPEHMVERHHRTQGTRSTIKLNWEDENGDSGDQYWEFNHDSSESEDGKSPKRSSDTAES